MLLRLNSTFALQGCCVCIINCLIITVRHHTFNDESKRKCIFIWEKHSSFRIYHSKQEHFLWIFANECMNNCYLAIYTNLWCIAVNLQIMSRVSSDIFLIYNSSHAVPQPIHSIPTVFKSWYINATSKI